MKFKFQNPLKTCLLLSEALNFNNYKKNIKPVSSIK